MSFRPSPGFSVVRHKTGTSSKFNALGPLARGDMVRRMIVNVHALGTDIWRFGASLGLSQSPTQGALLAGRSLITFSDNDAINGDQGMPHLGFVPVAGMSMRFEFFPGLRVTGAAGWIVTHIFTGAAPSTVVCAAFEIVNVANRVEKVSVV